MTIKLMQRFSITNLEKKYYVYFLIDPRTRLPFYVGKGSGERAIDHLKETKEIVLKKKTNWLKFCKIKNIRKYNLEPEIHYIRQNLDKNTAYNIESKLIKFWGREGIESGGILTNRCEDNRPPSSKGRKYSDKIKKNYKKSVEHKKSISKANKGKNPWNKDIFQAGLKPILCIELGIIFLHPNYASQYLGLKDSNRISKSASNGYGKSGGYCWRYAFSDYK